MIGLKATIIEFIDDGYPGWVRCTFSDISNIEYFIVEKIPIVSDGYDDSLRDAVIPCIIQEEIINDAGATVVTIDIDKPYNISDENGETVFRVFKHQLIEVDN